MLRNYLAAALRNLLRNRLYAAINIVGLAVGFAAALLIALFVGEELSYDRWIPGHERTYLVPETITFNNGSVLEGSTTGAEIAGWLKQDIPEIENVARLEQSELSLRRGNVESLEPIYFADRTFFAVIPLPAYRGDLATALDKPDSIVVTRQIARKYFGRDDVLGETLELSREHPLVVTAVLQDLPPNTHLASEIYVAGHAAFSPLAIKDAQPPPLLRGNNSAQDLTYVRLAVGARAEPLADAVANVAKRRMPSGAQTRYTPRLTPLAEIHMESRIVPMRQPGHRPTIQIISAVGVLLVVISTINFVNLTTARTTRRAVEVGVRKATGGRRIDIILQFLGEGMLYIVLALGCAFALAEVARPALNALVGTEIRGDYWRSPALMVVMLGVPLIIGALSAAYPAFLASAFSPAAVLKGREIRAVRGFGVRRALVVVQFAVLVGLILAVTVITRQSQFATSEALRVSTEQVLTIRTTCGDAFRQEVAALPGVTAAACSNGYPGRAASNQTRAQTPNGPLPIWNVSVDADFFELYGLHPLAGRFFGREPADSLVAGPPGRRLPVVINETTVRALQLGAPSEAVGSSFGCSLGLGRRMSANGACEVIGVVPDYADDSVREPIRPSVYFQAPGAFSFLNVKLRGRDVPETLAAIDRLWAQLGEPRPIARSFVDQRMQELYLSITRQGQALTIFAGVALFIACLGLFGLSSYTAEARRKEIGIRKAMGASRRDIVVPMLWHFTKPVLRGCLIAWPIGYFVMDRWLAGFVYHIDLSPWLFLATGAAALLIAVLTVLGHALLVARAQPATALRYE